jgi:hypothetical protein
VTDHRAIHLSPAAAIAVDSLPDGAGKRDRLDYCLTSTPAIVDGRMYFRGSDSLWCHDSRQ